MTGLMRLVFIYTYSGKGAKNVNLIFRLVYSFMSNCKKNFLWNMVISQQWNRNFIGIAYFYRKKQRKREKNPRQRGLGCYVVMLFYVAMLFYVSCRIDETCHDVYLVLNKEDKGVKDRHCR
jgi:hypothetical protein